MSKDFEDKLIEQAKNILKGLKFDPDIDNPTFCYFTDSSALIKALVKVDKNGKPIKARLVDIAGHPVVGEFSINGDD